MQSAQKLTLKLAFFAKSPNPPPPRRKVQVEILNLFFFIIALWALGKNIHEVRDKWRIYSNCPCRRSKADMLLNNKNGVSQLLHAVNQCIGQAENSSPTGGKVNGVSGDVYSRHGAGVNGGSPNNAVVNPLSLLADVAIDSDNNSIDGKKLSRVKEALQERLQNTGTSQD